MGIKLYNSSTWNTQKSLKVYASSLWNTAKQGWVYNGSSWNLMYPEYPLNTAAPTISGGTAIGDTLTTTNGTWTSTDAYSPVSYSYQWKSGVTNVGSNQNTYVTVSGDVGNAITCQVTAINQRGSTPVTSSNSITVSLPAPSSISVYDATPTPGAFSVYGSGGQNSWSATHSASSNASYYAGAAGSTGSQPSSGQVWSPGGAWYSSSQTFQSLQTWGAGTVTIYVFAVNTNPKISVSWAAVSGATSYDVVWSGGASGSVNTASTSYDIYPGTTSSISVSVTSKSGSTVGGSISGSASGTNPDRLSQTSVTVTNPAAVAPSTPTGLVNTYSASNGPGWTLTWNSSSGTAPINYTWTLYQSNSNGGSTTASTNGSTTGNTTGRIAMNSANGLWGQFYLYANNAAGSSSAAISSWA